MGAIKKAGVEFYAKIDTNRDLIGAADQFSAEVIVDATGDILTDDSANASIGAFTEVGSTGIYRAPITLTDEGDFTVSVKWTDGETTEYIPFPVEVKSADMSDIKDLIDAVQTDLTAVKEQVDVLDEEAVNNIVNQVDGVQSTVTDIKTLISDYTGSFVIEGDETALLTVGSEVTGDTSGATGAITEATYDGTNTSVKLDSQSGAFVGGETVSVDGVSSTGTIVSVANNAVNSVMEFVTAIDEALTGGGSSLDVLASYTDNLELMLEGKAYTDTEGNAVAEEDSFGLAEIYNEIVANGNDIATANAAISDLSNDVAVFRTSVESKVDDVQAAIDAMNDESNSDSLISKVNAVKTVVDANSAVLTDVGYGNEAIKNLIDTLETNLDSLIADWADGGRLETRFDDIDANATANTTTITDAIDALDSALATANTDIQDLINAQTATLEGRFDDVDSALANISGAQQYKGFV